MVDIRAGHERDLPELIELYNHYVRETVATFDIQPFTAEQRRAWLSRYAPSGRHRLLVAVGAERILGFATSSRYRDREAYDTSVATSVFLDPQHTGRGIGSLLYTALFEALQEEDVHRACAGITLPNPASVALHERFGFTRVGVFTEQGQKFGRYWDVAWYEKPL